MKDYLKYNLQFFAEEGDSNADDSSGSTDSNTDSNRDEVDVKALAEIISDKDRELKELAKQVEELKKANAKMSTGNRDSAKTFDENLFDLVGYKPRKE